MDRKGKGYSTVSRTLLEYEKGEIHRVRQGMGMG